jgi:Methyltransferase FkbM domain
LNIDQYIKKPTNVTSSSSSSSARWSDEPQIDILQIDTEGFDALVLKGARQLLEKGLVRLLIFEYHGKDPWPQYPLKDIVDSMKPLYDCFFEGTGRLWRLTGV